ncbi:LuxR C-terminal-related transcriptional regulator [Yoonia vestfoldensis]|uniref:LuxR C-terminal-related transcriptional regulator n=1 Tax=Yoonia vestfoldensis TaxID=245188 RepID=UPI001B7FAC4E|nr:LuxR C-terminal-related transcriptional regulator [Yoonia vestfoldensis]
MTASRKHSVTVFGPSAPGDRSARAERTVKPEPTVAALLAVNAVLMARNAALPAALGRDGTPAETREARSDDRIAPAPVHDAAIRHPVLPRVSEVIQKKAGSALIASLTTRQAQILQMVLAGQPSKNIAADLQISQRTVENHRAAIMRRTGATSLPALARMAVGARCGADCKSPLRHRAQTPACH